MYDVEQAPVFWLLELLAGLAAMFALQLVCGASALIIARYHTPLFVQFAFVLVVCTLLGFLSAVIIDYETHLINAILAGLSFSFVTPLQAFAYMYRSRRLAKSGSQSYVAPSSEWYGSSSSIGIVVRIAIPASSPSALYPADSAKHQVRRGVLYFTVASLFSELYDHITHRGGLLLDLYALSVLTCGAFGALNLTSASMSLFGYQTARPFRSPFTSPSMTQFWAGRWNAPVSDSLRYGIYEPLMEAGVPRAVSSLACFIISGISHEIILLYAGVWTSKGEWLTFFVLSGVAAMVEKYTFSKLDMMLPIKRFLSVATLFWLFHAYFVPVTLRTGLAKEGVQALAANRMVIIVLGQLVTEYLYRGPPKH